MSPRVLHVSQPSTAGVARAVLQGVDAVLTAGWAAALACPPGPLAEAAAARGAEALPWPAGRAPGPATLQETRRLAGILAGARPDLVHLHSSKAGLAGRLALRGRRPTVFSPHAWSFEPLSGPARRAAVGWERRAATHWTALLVCVGRAELDLGRAAGISARALVVPNGVDLGEFPYADLAAREAARHRLGLPAGPLAVCLGRLDRQKGQDLLLAAWPTVRTMIPTARLALVGDGPWVRRLAAALPGGVWLAGPTAAPADWLAAADIVVVPSRWEGLAFVPLEAMATGRPVVASAIAANAEAVPPAAGAVVDVTDRGALAGAIAARLGDPARAGQEGLAGRRHVEAAHDRRHAGAQLLAAYRAVLRRS